jgi:hypothetical protein
MMMNPDFTVLVSGVDRFALFFANEIALMET